MPHVPRLDLLLYGGVALLVVAFGVRWLSGRGEQPGGGPPAAHAAEGGVSIAQPAARLVVHVAGAVRRPGVYRLREGARVQDALARAGGPTRKADVDALNLAARLEDGRQVVVPRRARAPAAGAAAGPAGGGATAGAGTGAVVAGPVSLSTASEAELDALAGVGPATVQKIIEYRTEHGGFGSVEDLGEVPGIGDKRLETLRELVTP